MTINTGQDCANVRAWNIQLANGLESSVVRANVMKQQIKAAVYFHRVQMMHTVFEDWTVDVLNSWCAHARSCRYSIVSARMTSSWLALRHYSCLYCTFCWSMRSLKQYADHATTWNRTRAHTTSGTPLQWEFCYLSVCFILNEYLYFWHRSMLPMVNFLVAKQVMVVLLILMPFAHLQTTSGSKQLTTGPLWQRLHNRQRRTQRWWRQQQRHA